MFQKEGVLTLTIKHLEENDTDIYICDVGTAKSMAKVTVNGKNLYVCVCVHDVRFRCSCAEPILLMQSVGETIEIMKVSYSLDLENKTKTSTVFKSFYRFYSKVYYKFDEPCFLLYLLQFYTNDMFVYIYL